ncbi:ralA-binding protein 1-like isoform X2 [Anthonomus grandis grandis]|uniref:ralA-binding protein 1-like isoform X2 n=1 Tax=Anthonomus grandis grandis TaxID=2921223 RepID=UPI0021662999|nr:ralA-binding protein 1-like isoform X2 [Anthonomus grandis grandis]
MERLKYEHENVRILASRELFKFGIKMKLKKTPSKKYSPKKRCYKIDLNHLEDTEVQVGKDVIQVPKVYFKLVEFIKNHLQVEGVFRKEGSKVKERVLLKMLDSGYEIPEDTDPIVACAVLKVFLRTLPGKLVPHDVVPWFLAAAQLSDHSADAVCLCALLLPLRNVYLLVYLMQFFSEVTAHERENKMNAYNLAVVAAPNLFKDDVGTVEEIARHNAVFINIVKIFIEKSKSLGQVPACLLDKLDALHEEHNNATSKGLCRWVEKWRSFLTS